ncbi:MAG: ParB/RepB/Spo0J family partition protein [Candidatus Saccharimonadales bacterium]
MSGKSGLGRGLGSLIPESFDASLLVDDGERIEHIALDMLAANPDQPRTIFDKTALEELAESIRRYGIVQPLVVSPTKTGYIIVAGERRWRAARLAGLKTVPSLVRTTKELELLEIALVENVQRVDLDPIEQAVSIERLHQQFNLSYSDIAKRLGKAETTLSNIVRLLQLPAAARTALQEGRITEGHARQILALKTSPEKQTELLQLILSQGWSVRQAERFVTSIKAGHVETKVVKTRLASETPETKKLSKQYRTPIKIYRTAKGGRLEISFTSEDDLTRLIQELQR